MLDKMYTASLLKIAIKTKAVSLYRMVYNQYFPS